MDPLFVRFCDRLYLACVWLAGLAIFLMSVIIPYGVFTRYVLGTGSAWPEPIAILFMMVFTFIGAAAGYRAGAHIAVTMITDPMPVAVQGFLRVLVNLLMILVCLFVCWYGTSLCIETWNQSIAELDWLPVGLTYAAIPLGSLATLLFVIERMVYGSQAERDIVRYEEVEAAPEQAEGAR